MPTADSSASKEIVTAALLLVIGGKILSGRTKGPKRRLHCGGSAWRKPGPTMRRLAFRRRLERPGVPRLYLEPLMRRRRLPAEGRR
jgi:hypothetical protein